MQLPTSRSDRSFTRLIPWSSMGLVCLRGGMGKFWKSFWGGFGLFELTTKLCLVLKEFLLLRKEFVYNSSCSHHPQGSQDSNRPPRLFPKDGNRKRLQIRSRGDTIVGFISKEHHESFPDLPNSLICCESDLTKKMKGWSKRMLWICFESPHREMFPPTPSSCFFSRLWA